MRNDEPVCDRCQHLFSQHDRQTKYTSHACNKRDKHMARIHKETKEGVIHDLSGGLIYCLCDCFFAKVDA